MVVNWILIVIGIGTVTGWWMRLVDRVEGGKKH